MAEVRKKVIEDKYNTKSINTDKKKKDVKKVENKKSNSKKKEKKEKKGLWTRFMIFCHGVKSEFDKVHWTQKNDMIKYSISTIVIVLFLSLFFYLIDVIFALIQSLIG